MSTPADLLEDLTDDVDAVFVFSPSSGFYEQFEESAIDVVVVAPENNVDAETYVELPLPFENVRDRIRFGIEGAMDRDIVDDGDEVACVVSIFGDDHDSLVRVRVDEAMHSGVYGLFANSRADPGVIRDVFEVVIELGKKGQKGKPVGALFVIGDAGKVMNKSRPLSYNPFEKSHVHVGDPIVNVMLKEFSRLDGAFVISDSGKIVSAYRYLEAGAEGVDIPKGLGTRHMAGAAITRATNATAIVLSESDGMVRAFKGGELILEIDPEDY
jgi:DNA integrity scanning protein DisA with diadenylate cyclase activity